MQYKNILVYLDQGASNKERVNTAIALATAHSAHLTGVVVNALPNSSILNLLGIGKGDALVEQAQVDARVTIEHFEMQTDKAGIEADTRVIECQEGKAPEKLARMARIFDLSIMRQANPDTPNEVILDEIRRLKPDLIGLSFLSTTSYPYAKILARQIRAANVGVKIALGGVFVSLNAPQVKAQCSEVDFVCRGDGEDLILELLDNLDDPASVAGVVWADENGQVRQNPSRPIPMDLDHYPFPDRESLPLDFIESMPLDVPAVLSLERYTTVQTSRGCPWPCVFCDIPIFNEGKWRARSPEHVVAELKQLEEDGYGTVFFVDDQFLLRPKRIEAMCKGINDNNLTIQWGCEGRVDSKCMQLFPAMAKANCRTMMFGIESGSQKVLDRLKKGQTLEEIESAVTNAKQAGIEIVHGFFVVGSPDETEEDMRETFSFASRLRIDSFGFNRLCVYRGTPLWKEYVERGLVDDEKDWDKMFPVHSIHPDTIDSKTLFSLRSKLVKRLVRRKITKHPRDAAKVLLRFLQSMSLRDVYLLLTSSKSDHSTKRV